MILEEIHSTSSVIILGVGGGGDVSWSIPLINLLQSKGVTKIAVGEPSIAWWDLEGRIALGGFVFHANDLDNIHIVSPGCAIISPKSKILRGPGKGATLPQSIIAGMMGVEAYVLEFDRGVKGMVKDLETLSEKFGADLIIGVDCGSDSLYSGIESKVLSPLVDAMVVATLAKTNRKTMMGLIGYGCDGDLMPEEIDRRLSEVTKEDGVIDVLGLSNKDKQYLENFFERFPNPVEEWPLKAAKGEYGWKNFNSLWSIYVSFFTSLMLFLDPKVIMKQNPLARAIADSSSLSEAEKATLKLKLIPETKLLKLLPKLVE